MRVDPGRAPITVYYPNGDKLEFHRVHGGWVAHSPTSGVDYPPWSSLDMAIEQAGKHRGARPSRPVRRAGDRITDDTGVMQAITNGARP